MAGPTVRLSTRLVHGALVVAIVAFTGACAATEQPSASPNDTTSDSKQPATTEPKPIVASTTPWKLDQPWSRAVAVNDNGTLLIFSGLDAAKRSVSRVIRIDPRTGQTTTAPKLPRALHDAAGVSLNGTTMLIGGGEQETGQAEVTAVAGPRAGKDLGRLPQPRSDLVAIVVGDAAYVIGGYDGKTLPADIVVTHDGASFQPAGQLNPAVRYPAVATAGGKIYVFGGKTATGQTDAIQQLDPSTKTVSTVGHLPSPLGHAVAFELDGTIYLAGGRTGNATSDTGNTVSSTIWAFDPRTGGMHPVGQLPSPVADAGIAVVDGHAYIIGGEKDGADTPIGTVTDIHL